MKVVKTLLYVLLTFLILACKKGTGAICNDGSRSHSTGRGTCSWHGGVHHYIDPNEIDLGSTTGLIVILIIGVYIFFKLRQ